MCCAHEIVDDFVTRVHAVMLCKTNHSALSEIVFDNDVKIVQDSVTMNGNQGKL